jgi:hypothetical protein
MSAGKLLITAITVGFPFENLMKPMKHGETLPFNGHMNQMLHRHVADNNYPLYREMLACLISG